MSSDTGIWLPLFIGLTGAIIGAAASIIAVVVQARSESKRNRTALIADLAMKETDHAWRLLQDSGQPGEIPPPVVYMHYYEEILKSFDKDDFYGDKYRAICEDNRRFIEITKDIEAQAHELAEGNEAFRQHQDD